MGRVDIPLAEPQEPVTKELPQCAWCGERSKTVCSRCKVRAYCSTECQRFDWKSGHQTACAVAPAHNPTEQIEEHQFQYYHIPYVAHWAINLRRWSIKPDSKEFKFLLSRIPDEDKPKISNNTSWPATKLALAKELAVRRMAEILTQGMWHKVHWKLDPATGREYLTDRTQYIWTGKKYVNSNLRFPNFNFSMMQAGEYLFVVSHPIALTGVFACGPLTPSMPDPRKEFGWLCRPVKQENGQAPTEGNNEMPTTGSVVPEVQEEADDESVEVEELTESPPLDDKVTDREHIEVDNSKVPTQQKAALASAARAAEVAAVVAAEAATAPEQQNTVEAPEAPQFPEPSEAPTAPADPDEDPQMLSVEEARVLCAASKHIVRRGRLRLALCGKLAYFRTIGQTRGRQWSKVVLGQRPVGENVPGGKLDADEQSDKPGRPRRHPLRVDDVLQSRWRCEVHSWRGHCVVVCRAPPAEAAEGESEFIGTQAARHPEVDKYDDILEHTEPTFIEIPIKHLLPDKYHTDYIRACGGGERGEQLRMNK